jgi:hypothetical protein
MALREYSAWPSKTSPQRLAGAKPRYRHKVTLTIIWVVDLITGIPLALDIDGTSASSLSELQEPSAGCSHPGIIPPAIWMMAYIPHPKCVA